MAKKVDNKFTWVIQGFSSLQSSKIYSDGFSIGSCKWRLLAYPKGAKSDSLSLYLGVADYESLPVGWRRQAKFSLKVVNQLSEKSSIRPEANPCWFDQKDPFSGFLEIIPLTKLHSKDGGFLVNDELKIVAEVDVLQVIGSDVSEGSQEAIQPTKKININDWCTGSSDLHKKTPMEKETIDVNGFQVSPSQVESMRCIFERHPHFASEVRSNNRHLKSAYMNVLLGLLETICKFPEELSDEDLDEASDAISYVTKVGFKVDWLENKHEELKEKKKTVNTAKAQLQHMEEEWQKHKAPLLHMEEELQKLSKKCLDLKALVEKENENMSVANVPFSFDDVV